MKSRLRKILIKLKLWDGNAANLQPTVRFPGGIVPIDETNPEDVFIVGFPKIGEYFDAAYYCTLDLWYKRRSQ